NRGDLVPRSKVAIVIESDHRRQRQRGGKPEDPKEQGQAPVHSLPVTLARYIQQSTTLMARPPSDVSLYLVIMSRPVSYIVLMTVSSATRWLPSPRSASDAALMAFTAPMALRSMHGIWTRPATGSQLMPRWCSMPISAAFSICALVPPSAAASPAAAIAQAT